MLGDPGPGGAGRALGNGQFLSAWDQLDCSQLQWEDSRFINGRRDMRHNVLVKKIVYSFTVQSTHEENKNWGGKSRQLSLPSYEQ